MSLELLSRESANIVVVIQAVSGQTIGKFTDADTGIIFATTTFTDAATKGGFTWGIALPANAATVDATEYVGMIVRLQINFYNFF